jgi:hypothetical protein
MAHRFGKFVDPSVTARTQHSFCVLTTVIGKHFLGYYSTHKKKLMVHKSPTQKHFQYHNPFQVTMAISNAELTFTLGLVQKTPHCDNLSERIRITVCFMDETATDLCMALVLFLHQHAWNNMPADNKSSNPY